MPNASSFDIQFLAGRMEKLDERLSAIDSKLDLIVRLEERQTNSDDALRRAFLRMDVLEGRVREVELRYSDTTGRAESTTSANEWLLRSMVGFAFTAIGGVTVWIITGGR